MDFRIADTFTDSLGTLTGDEHAAGFRMVTKNGTVSACSCLWLVVMMTGVWPFAAPQTIAAQEIPDTSLLPSAKNAGSMKPVEELR